MILISGQASLPAPNKRLPIGIHILDGIFFLLHFVVEVFVINILVPGGGIGWPGSGQIWNPLEPDDLVGFRLRDVDGLLLLQLVAERAVGQVEPVRDPT